MPVFPPTPSPSSSPPPRRATSTNSPRAPAADARRTSTTVLDADRDARDLTKRPVRELVALRRGMVPAVVGCVVVGLMCAVVPSFTYPTHAIFAGVGIVASVVAAFGAFVLSEHPACREVWGNHAKLDRFVHAWAPIGMLAWGGAFAAMLVSRAETTVGSTAPTWLTSVAFLSWWVYIPCFFAGSLGIACVSELLATVARKSQDEAAAERLRFSFLALWLMLAFCIPMWWSILNTRGPGLIIAVGASILVLACYARFASGYLPLLSTAKWLVLNAEDLASHEARLQEIQASRVRVSSDHDDTASKARNPQTHQTQPWAKPIFKNSNTLRKPGE